MNTVNTYKAYIYYNSYAYSYCMAFSGLAE